MPEGYEHMRDKFKKEGMSDEEAKAKAARIWNAKHKDNPVTRKKDEAPADGKVLDGDTGKTLEKH